MKTVRKRIGANFKWDKEVPEILHWQSNLVFDIEKFNDDFVLLSFKNEEVLVDKPIHL